MPSEFFNELVKIFDDIDEIDNAYEIVEKQSMVIGKTPDILQPEDGGIMAIQLMSEVSDSLPLETWEIVDNNIKELLSDEKPSRSKIKGILLNNTMNYVQTSLDLFCFELLGKFILETLKNGRSERSPICPIWPTSTFQ